MTMLGVAVAIIRDGRILLTKRKDFEVWCLPGGHVDSGESVATAAIREVREEVGLDVRLTRLVGIYSKPNWRWGGMHMVIFAGEPVGGDLQPQADEVLAIQEFGPNELPRNLFHWHRQYILDAFSGAGGSVVRSNDASWPFDRDISYEQLYTLRDQSSLAPHEFYARHIPGDLPRDETLDIV